MKAIVASDLHGLLNQYVRVMQKAVVEEADCILLAGDLYSRKQDMSVWVEYIKQIGQVCPVYMTPGNHDHWDPAIFDKIPRVHVVIDKAVTIKGVKVYFTPWSLKVLRNITLKPMPQYLASWVKPVKPFEEEADITLPKGTQVVVTHGPPYGVMDLVESGHSGSIKLWNAIMECPTVKYVFQGHIHGHHMDKRVIDGKTFQNVSVLDNYYIVKPDDLVVLNTGD